jgi:hypothetical protein
MKAVGVNGAVEIVGENLVLTRKLFFGKSKGAKSIAIRSLTAVQHKRAGLTAGFVQFVFSGSGESKGGVFDAASDENSIMFYKVAQGQFDALITAVEAARARPAGGAPAATAPDLADQLTRLGDLHAAGVLSADEFAAAKARLIG